MNGLFGFCRKRRTFRALLIGSAILHALRFAGSPRVAFRACCEHDCLTIQYIVCYIGYAPVGQQVIQRVPASVSRKHVPTNGKRVLFR